MRIALPPALTYMSKTVACSGAGSRPIGVGGPGAFVVPVYEWDFFPQAVRRKLVLELAMPALPPPPPRIIRAQAAAPGYDCLAGEKIWDKITAPPQSR